MTEQSEHLEASNNSSLVVFAALIASIGGILFGYDIGIISGALLQLEETFKLSYFEQELVVCGVLIGAFCASFFGGNIVDSWGRKAGILVSCGFFIIGSVILYLSINFTMLIIGRFIVGIAISLSVTAECTYISEISPPSRRGMMVSFNEVGVTAGFLFAYLMNYVFISIKNGWKFMFGVAVIPALLQVIGVVFMPNSHHYLLIKGHKQKAREVLTHLRRSDNVDDEIEAILTSINEQNNYRYKDLFSSAFNMRGRLFLGMALVFLQQFSGNANVLYYAPTVFQHFGYSTHTSATLVSVGLGIVKVVATIITVLIVDKVGRRSLLLTGSLLMAASIILLGILGMVEEKGYIEHSAFSRINLREYILHPLDTNWDNSSSYSPQLINRTNPREYILHPLDTNWDNSSSYSPQLINRTNHLGVDLQINSDKNEYEILNNSHAGKYNVSQVQNFTDINGGPSKIISVISLMVFVCAYSISYGPVTWLVLSEIFPGGIRGRAVSLATCINWASNIIVSLTFLDIINAMGIGPTFVTYGLLCFGAAIFILVCVPETKNKSLEEINEVLTKGMFKKGCAKACQQRKYSLKRSPLKCQNNTVLYSSERTISIRNS